MKKTVIKYILAIILIGIAIKLLFKGEYIALVKQISLSDLLITILISFFLGGASGQGFAYIIRKQYRTQLSLTDIFTLPFMMLFSGLIVPIKGGMLYSIFFFKSKYGVKISGGASITLFMYMVSFVLMGIAGLYYTVFIESSWPLALIAVVLIVNPLLLKMTKHLWRRVPSAGNKILNKLHQVTTSVLNESDRLGKDWKTVASVSSLVLLKYALRTLRYYWAAVVFGFDIPLFSLLLLTLSIELMNIAFRFSPGNLGLNELVSGGIINLMGNPTEEGILIALLCRFANLLLTFSIGFWAIKATMKYFKIGTLKSLWSHLKVS